MANIEILGSGRVDDRESAFPQAVQLPGGDVLCSFCVGGGPYATGSSDFARSTDGGETWTREGTILPFDERTGLSSHLKLSLSADRKTIYAYGARQKRIPGKAFGENFTEPVFCLSTDEGGTWTEPRVIPLPREGNFEISHGILPLSSGRLLAPAATLPALDRLGEKVLVGISDDAAQTWPRHSVVFQDPAGKLGYFEHKLAQLDSRTVMAVCWTVTFGEVSDVPNSFTLSHDGGLTWSPALSTGIQGQTMTPVPLGGDRLLVLFNRRYGEQGIVMCLVTFTEDFWTVHHEGLLYDARQTRDRPDGETDGREELKSFEFGFPTALRLSDGTFLTTHWCKEQGRFGVNWTKLRVDWS